MTSPAGFEKTAARDGVKKHAPPCGSCPYRRDVPSGIWHLDEYDKLLEYDGPTYAQPMALFMCHIKDGTLCRGWLACHGPRELLAMRLAASHGKHLESFDYETDVPVFASGEEARAHGIKDFAAPGPRAAKMIDGLVRSRRRK